MSVLNVIFFTETAKERSIIIANSNINQLLVNDGSGD